MDAASFAVREQSPSKTCSATCQASLATERDKSAIRHDVAVEKLNAMGIPREDQTPATALGVDQLRWDLIEAFVKAFGMNGMAAALIAFGTHQRARQVAESRQLVPRGLEIVDVEPQLVLSAPKVVEQARPVKPPVAELDRSKPQQPKRAHLSVVKAQPKGVSALETVDTFAVEVLVPAQESGVSFDDIWGAYERWSVAKGLPALPFEDFGRVFGEMVAASPLRIVQQGDALVLLGVRVEEARSAA